MAFDLKHCVIHELVKESGKQSVDTSIKPLLPEDDKHVMTLVMSLNDLIGKRENQAARGTFDTDDATFKVPPAFQSYYEGDCSADFFHAFTKVCMQELAKQAKDPTRVAASGGAIVFAHYQSNHTQFMLITMVKQKEALRLNKDLKPVGTVQLDLSKIHQAARINFDRYYQHETIESEEDKPTYLAFVSPKVNLDASGYFVASLGCSDSVPSAKATDGALNGVRNFFSANSELTAYKTKAYEAVLQYLNDKEPGELASLTEIEHVVRKVVPIEKQTNIDNFVDYLNSEEVGLPLEFSINRMILGKRSKVKAKSTGWELSFEKRFFGTAAGSVIQYMRNEKKLVISRLDEETIKKLEEALNDKG
ncbi:nucleoid-associated protein [Klebsiella variicola]|uniref:nucleoid-associated protein n=1 Tax=Klebsiella variicola TaxID=244366 RepID=UPI002F283D01|nr:nucleoid-associated protein [Klebsiella variicola]